MHTLSAQADSTQAASSAALPAWFPVDARAQFERDGYWLSPEPLFTAEELAQARAAAWSFWDGQRDHDLPNGDAYKPFDGAPGLRKNDYASLCMNDLWTLIEKPILSAIAAHIGGHAGLRFWHDQLLLKPPQDACGDERANVGWHTDRGYWRNCSTDQMLTAWVAIDAVEPDMGPLQVIPGSHTWVDPFDGNFFDADAAQQWRELTAQHADAEAVSLPMVPGQVSFHHCKVVHGSAPNTGSKSRLGLAVHMQPADNHYVQVLRADGSEIHHANDSRVRYRNGEPDYADPGWCPQLYPR